MRTRVNSELEATAHHEAGHAVAMYYLNLGFRYASIIPDSKEGTLGHVLQGRPGRWFTPDIEVTPRVQVRIETEVISLLAGQVAEAEYRGRRPRWGMHADNQASVNLASYVVGESETLEAYIHYLFLRTRDLVRVRRREIQWVARALLKQKRVTRADVRGVIDEGFGFKARTGE